MKHASSSSLEVAVALPLGVASQQLMRIESDLRLLQMKVPAVDADARQVQAIASKLDHIKDTLDAIRSLVTDIEGDLHPKDRATPRTAAERSKPRQDRED